MVKKLLYGTVLLTAIGKLFGKFVKRGGALSRMMLTVAVTLAVRGVGIRWSDTCSRICEQYQSLTN